MNQHVSQLTTEDIQETREAQDVWVKEPVKDPAMSLFFFFLFTYGSTVACFIYYLFFFER